MKNRTNLSKLMNKLFATALFLSIPMISSAANYSYIDAGDRYYINGFGDNNQYVEVVRKLGDSRVKVRDLHTYETQEVYASKLLTESELHAEEIENGAKAVVVGLAIAVCIFNPDECK